MPARREPPIVRTGKSTGKHCIHDFQQLLAVGGAHIDRRGRISGPYVPGASNPGMMREDVGGGVFNALRNAVQRGVAASLLSVRGGDAAGANVARAIAEASIGDLSAVFLDRATPSYTALLDREGDVIAGLADMELYEIAFAKQIRRSKPSRQSPTPTPCCATPTCRPPRFAAAGELAAGKPVFAIAISPAKAVRLAGTLAAISCLFMNRARGSRACRPCRERAPANRRQADGAAGLAARRHHRRAAAA